MQHNFEDLSSAHDGECNAQDLLRMLDAIDSDEAARDADALYRLIGDAMRDPESPTLSVNVTAAVMRSVAREPVPQLPPDAVVRPFSVRQRAVAPQRSFLKTLGASAAAVAAVGFVSAWVWNASTAGSDPVVAYVIFEQPRSHASQVVHMENMPPELVDYLLAHRQNSMAGSMNAGSAVIRANASDALATERTAAHPNTDMEWVRLWDSRPVYVTPRAVER